MPVKYIMYCARVPSDYISCVIHVRKVTCEDKYLARIRAIPGTAVGLYSSIALGPVRVDGEGEWGSGVEGAGVTQNAPL